MIKKRDSQRFLLLLGFALFANFARSQTTANTTMNVVLADIRSIKVNPAQNTVSLNFATASDYDNGVSSLQNAHLEISSTGGFIVSAKSSSPNLVNGANTIPVNTIKLTPSLSAIASNSTTIGTPTNRTISLSPIQTTFISSRLGATKVFFDVDYKASGGAQYINKAAGTYTSTITYTIDPL